jgi:hypothetical protein
VASGPVDAAPAAVGSVLVFSYCPPWPRIISHIITPHIPIMQTAAPRIMVASMFYDVPVWVRERTLNER